MFQLEKEKKEEEQRDKKNAPERLKDIYIGLDYQRLMSFTNAEDEDYLPLVYGEILFITKQKTVHQIV